jgi:hypothetical protein
MAHAACMPSASAGPGPDGASAPCSAAPGLGRRAAVPLAVLRRAACARRARRAGSGRLWHHLGVGSAAGRRLRSRAGMSRASQTFKVVLLGEGARAGRGVGRARSRTRALTRVCGPRVRRPRGQDFAAAALRHQRLFGHAAGHHTGVVPHEAHHGGRGDAEPGNLGHRRPGALPRAGPHLLPRRGRCDPCRRVRAARRASCAAPGGRQWLQPLSHPPRALCG